MKEEGEMNKIPFLTLYGQRFFFFQRRGGETPPNWDTSRSQIYSIYTRTSFATIFPKIALDIVNTNLK